MLVRVFVTGGTEAIGSYAVPALIGAGHTVSALARTQAKARVVQIIGTYNIVDDKPVTTRDNTLAMADALGSKPWVIGPGRLALVPETAPAP